MKPLKVVSASAALAIGAVSVPLSGQTPQKLEQVPVFPGATRQPDREAEETSPEETFRTVRIYRVGAPIEDVVRFYQQRLQAKETPEESESDVMNAAMERLAPGQSSQVILTLGPVNLTEEPFIEIAQPGGKTPAQLAAAMRAAYTQKRTPLRPGVWLVSAGFWWAGILPAGEQLQFTLKLEGVEGFEIQRASYHHLTEIVVNLQREAPPVAEAEPEERPAAPLAAPSAAALGVPLYPGAKFDGRMSGQMSASDEEANYYVYTSTDTPQQVTAFYQTRTGKKGITNEGGTMIAVKGEGLFPELGVTIQPNMGTYPPAVKTMLAIRKRR